jgi:hypothetical protein
LPGKNYRFHFSNYLSCYYWYSFPYALLLQYDKSAVIRYSAQDGPGHLNYFIFPGQDRQRLQYLPPAQAGQATYFLSTFRWHQQAYPYREIYSIRVDGMKILSVFKVK